MATGPGSRSFRFRAVIEKKGMGYTVDVPASVSAALGPAKKIPVVFTVDGSGPRQTTLAPRAGGGHRMHVHSEARRASGTGPGDMVTIVLRRDLDPSGPLPPPDLAEALREADVYEVFRTMGPAVQRELVAYVEKAKHEETRAKYVARVVERACAEREKRVDRG